jgi:hypothetical protein
MNANSFVRVFISPLNVESLRCCFWFMSPSASTNIGKLLEICKWTIIDKPVVKASGRVILLKSRRPSSFSRNSLCLRRPFLRLSASQNFFHLSTSTNFQDFDLKTHNAPSATGISIHRTSVKMPPASNEEQFKFLISCIRYSNNGKVREPQLTTWL